MHNPSNFLATKLCPLKHHLAGPACRSEKVSLGMQLDLGRARYIARSYGLMSVKLIVLAALTLIVMSVLSKQLMAQGPRIEAAVSTESIFIGETIDLQVEVQNLEDPKAPDLSLLKESFDIESLGDESRNQSSTFIINGRVSQKNVFAHVYAYRLTPKSAGKLTIPSLTISIDGRELKSNAIPIEVQDIEVQDVVIIETIPSQRTLFPTQSFSVTLKILVKPLPDSQRDPLQAVRRPPPHLTVGWIDPPEGLQAEDKSDLLRTKLAKSGVGFTLNDYSTQSVSLFDSRKKAVFDLSNGRESRNDLNGNAVEYFVYELTRSFTAGRPSIFLFDNASLKGTFVTAQSDGDYQGRRIVAIATPVRVEVKDVPSDRPKNYTGGIGKYQVSASANPMTLRVGDPLTLTLEFEKGKQGGSLDLLSPPNLGAMKDLVQDFEIVDSNPTGRLEGNSKKFSFALRPKRAGVSIPEIRLSTFDPDRVEFPELATSPITLTVSEATALGSSEIVGTVLKSNSNVMKQNSEGIFGNITDPLSVHNDLPNWTAPVSLVATVWSLSAAGIAAIYMRRRKDRSPDKQLKSRAKQNALAGLQRAGRQTDNPKEALRLVRLAILGLVADCQGRSRDGMTKVDVQDALDRSSTNSQDRNELMRLLEDLDSMEYGSVAGSSPSEYVDRAEGLVKRISSTLRRPSRVGSQQERG